MASYFDLRKIYETFREEELLRQRDKISGHLYDWSKWDLAEYILNSLSLEEQEKWYNQLLEKEEKEKQKKEDLDVLDSQMNG